MVIKVREKNKLRKITGSKCGIIITGDELEKLKYFLFLSGVYKYDFDENIFTKAGKIIEDIVFDYENKLNDYCWLSYDAEDLDFDQFKDNNIFGGLLDGVWKKHIDGLLPKILEIKTCSYDKFVWEEKYIPEKKCSEWFLEMNGRKPKIKTVMGNDWKKKFEKESNYWLQGLLYCYLSKIDVCLFSIALLQDYDYAYPNDFKCDGNVENILIDYNEKDYNVYIKRFEDFYNIVKTGEYTIFDKKCIDWIEKNKITLNIDIV